jgi:glycosyltransferase involved in cell wall biosynthesis
MSTRTHTISRELPFDGVICFGGEDWWYHNRGHYDMQMMRELSAHVPVLYINSIGMRMPRVGEGRMFLTRIERKLRSISRGVVQVRPNFTVMSPTVIPGRLGMNVSRTLLAAQVNAAARQLGISRAIVWVACPPAEEVASRIDSIGLVYQRTDRYETFHNVDGAVIAGYDRRMKARADLTLFCSTTLYEAEREQCRHAKFVDHGVDYEWFSHAGMDPQEPGDVRDLSRPRAGFIGGIDAHTFDPDLFVEVARRLPRVQFVLIGACSLPPGWCREANVHMLGQRPYDAVAHYMASCDVLIMPWNRSEWIAACNPVKLKEYLAVGRPVVTTWFDELRRYDGLVHVASASNEFAEAIQRAIDNPDDSSWLRARVQDEKWSKKAEAVIAALMASRTEVRAA